MLVYARYRLALEHVVKLFDSNIECVCGDSVDLLSWTIHGEVRKFKLGQLLEIEDPPSFCICELADA